MIVRIYKLYFKKIYPRISHIRGTTWLLRNFKKLLSLFKDTITISVNGVSLKMRFFPKLSCGDESTIFGGGTINHRLDRYNLRKGDTVIDAGAYPGDFAIYAAKKVGSEGRVIAFEPVPGNLKVLKKNIKLNKLKNIKIIEKGLWNKKTKKTLKVDRSHRGGNTILGTRDNPKGEKEITAELASLDEIAEEDLNINKIDFIKMDIEGAELEALRGMEKSLKKYKPHLVIASYHIRNSEKTYKRVEKILEEYGYEVETPEPPHNWELATFAWKEV